MGCAPSTNAITPATAPTSSPLANDTVKPLRVEITTLPAPVEDQQREQQRRPQQQHQQQHGQKRSPSHAPSKASLLRLGSHATFDDDDDDDDDEGGEDGDDLLEKTLQQQMRQRDSGLSLGEPRSGRHRVSAEEENLEDLFGVEASSKALHSLVGGGGSGAEEEEVDVTDAGFVVGSAHSNTSMASDDSGISSDRMLAAEGGYVCEYSDLDKLEEVKNNFHEPDPLALEGLLVIGKKCSAKLRTKEKHEESRILESLAAQGLLTSESVKAKRGGVAFELRDENDEQQMVHRPPRRLQSLKKRKKKKITPEEIEDKMANAERNRQRQMEEVRSRMRQEDEKVEQVSKNAMDILAEDLRKKEEEAQRKTEAANEKRKRRLQEVKERLRRKNEKAEAIKNSVLAERRGEDASFIEWDHTGGAGDEEEEDEEEEEGRRRGGMTAEEENNTFKDIYSSKEFRRRELVVEMS